MRIIDSTGYSQANVSASNDLGSEISIQNSTLLAQNNSLNARNSTLTAHESSISSIQINKINYTDIDSAPTNNFSKIISSKWAYDNLRSTGTIIPFSGDNIPNGYLPCKGATIGSDNTNASYVGADYEDLFNIINDSWGNLGTEVWDTDSVILPDLRGKFLRGRGESLVNGRTKTGPTIGNVQEDQMQEHAHPVTNMVIPDDIKVDDNNQQSVQADSFVTRNSLGASAEYNSQGTPRRGVETFPTNYGILFIIKI